MTLFIDPVIDTEGNTYERDAIERWLQLRNRSPITRSPMGVDDLVPNRAMLSAVAMHTEEQKELQRQQQQPVAVPQLASNAGEGIDPRALAEQLISAGAQPDELARFIGAMSRERDLRGRGHHNAAAAAADTATALYDVRVRTPPPPPPPQRPMSPHGIAFTRHPPVPALSPNQGPQRAPRSVTDGGSGSTHATSVARNPSPPPLSPLPPPSPPRPSPSAPSSARLPRYAQRVAGCSAAAATVGVRRSGLWRGRGMKTPDAGGGRAVGAG